MQEEYYVWYDTFLEDLYTMTKKDLDTNFQKLKTQLEKEHVTLHCVTASSSTEAFQQYHQTHAIESSYKKPSMH